MSQSVLVLGSDQPPLSYQIGIDGTLTVLCAYALFVSTGAIEDWMPCLSFYDSDGNLISRAGSVFLEAGSPLSTSRSWFPATVEQAVTFEQVAAMPPHVALDKGCEVVFDAVTYDGSSIAGVEVQNAVLRADVTNVGVAA